VPTFLACNGEITGLAIIGSERERTVSCKACGSDKRSKFIAEVAIHFPGLSGLDEPTVFVFPELLVCLNCGNAEFAVPENELRVLAKGNAASAR
jgi:hypothetical protein